MYIFKLSLKSYDSPVSKASGCRLDEWPSLIPNRQGFDTAFRPALGSSKPPLPGSFSGDNPVAASVEPQEPNVA
jgi:hypothetical protein